LALKRAGYPVELARINSSSGITHPWAKNKEAAPANWEKVSVDALKRLNDEIAHEL
jgi:orotidine-5'-phosphate decarboxylase